jgi:hypothetical protein
MAIHLGITLGATTVRAWIWAGAGVETAVAGRPMTRAWAASRQIRDVYVQISKNSNSQQGAYGAE